MATRRTTSPGRCTACCPRSTAATTRALPTPATVPADADKGQLRRFLDLPGGAARPALQPRPARRCTCPTSTGSTGRCCRCSAQWIGWRTDYGLPIAAQRNEIRYAPQALPDRSAAFDALDATVARVTGWPSRTKEFVHNVARTNQPERLNLWSMTRDRGRDRRRDPSWLGELRLRRAARRRVRPDGDGSMLFVYHTHRRHGWDIWAKRFADGWLAAQRAGGGPARHRQAPERGAAGQPAVAVLGDATPASRRLRGGGSRVRAPAPRRPGPSSEIVRRRGRPSAECPPPWPTTPAGCGCSGWNVVGDAVAAPLQPARRHRLAAASEPATAAGPPEARASRTT